MSRIPGPGHFQMSRTAIRAKVGPGQNKNLAGGLSVTLYGLKGHSSAQTLEMHSGGGSHLQPEPARRV